MAAFVVDASVAVKWFLAEDRAAAAFELLESDDELLAPATAPLEIFHALWLAVRTGRVAEPLPADIETHVLRSYTRLVPIEDLFVPSARLAQALAHPIYDCAYLVLAEREGAPLVTADERLFAAARKARIKTKLL